MDDGVNVYVLRQMPNGDIQVDHDSCFYPHKLEKKINELAGEEITCEGCDIPFAPGLRQNFGIKAEHFPRFVREIIPKIFTNTATDGSFHLVVRDEMAEANQI